MKNLLVACSLIVLFSSCNPDHFTGKCTFNNGASIDYHLFIPFVVIKGCQCDSLTSLRAWSDIPVESLSNADTLTVVDGTITEAVYRSKK